MKKNIFAVVELFLLIFVCLPMNAQAMGEGDGGGGGPSVPLEMVWSYPANGATGISVHVIIQCKYSHNVAHSDVKDRNAQKLSLFTQDGVSVAADVYMVDAQLEFDKRQYIYLYPKQTLKPYTTYVVTAEEGLQAKNSMATETEQTFCFTTGGAEPESVSVAMTTPEEESPSLAISSTAFDDALQQGINTNKETVPQSEAPQTTKVAAEIEQTVQPESASADKAAQAETPASDLAKPKPNQTHADIAAVCMLLALGVSVLIGILKRKR